MKRLRGESPQDGSTVEFGGRRCHRVASMAKHTNKIWRTVVFSGAMLMTPLAVGCGGGSKKPDTTPQTVNDGAAADPGDQAAGDEAAAKAQREQAEQEAAAKSAEEQRLLADKEAADKKMADELAAKEAADKKTAEEAAAKEAATKKRPRSTGKARPTGRGFILS